MTGLLTVCALGFLLGVRHATDPDHVVAVSTIVSRHRSLGGAALIGALWGVGHTVTIVLVGGAIILFGWVIPPRVGLSMEFSVALMLIALGVFHIAMLLRQVRRGAWGGNTETARARVQTSTPTTDGRIRLRPLAIGVVHGMAGSAAVALLVMAAIGRSSWALLYLLVFGAGTVVGMMLITAVIGVPFAHSGKRAPRLHHGLRFAAGAMSLGLGLLLAYKIGWVDGLFTGNPAWTPH